MGKNRIQESLSDTVGLSSDPWCLRRENLQGGKGNDFDS